MFFSRIGAACGILAFCLLTGLAGLPDAHAQPSGARGDDFIYRVMPGNTLIDLSNRFTGSPDNWPALQSINSISDPYALPVGLELRIPFSMIPEVDAAATVTHVQGRAFINQQPARPQDTVNEGDVLETAEDGFITFQMPDGTISALPPKAKIRVARLRTFLGTGLVDTILELGDGGLESTVAPDNRGTGRYEVRTPVSITGVRGTRLRVRTGDQGALTEVLSGSIQLGTDQADGPQLGSQQGTAVTPDGNILAARPLLPAPALALSTDQPASRMVTFDPVPGAVAYQVRVAADESGTQAVWTDQITEPPAHYRTPGSGTWYVMVRAVDDLGLMSDDATLAVEGLSVLISGFGIGITTSFGDPVLLTDY